MAVTGFKELLDRIKAEGQLARDTEADSVGGMTAILELINVQVTTQTVLMKMSVDKLTEMNSHIKELVEDLKRSSQFADVKLADSVRKSVGGPESVTGASGGESLILDLLSLAGLTAGLIGAAIGVVKGQLKAINFFSGGLIGKAVAALQGKILTVVDDIGKSIINGFKAVRNTVAAGLIVAAQILDFSKDSKFLAIITKISNFIGYITKPFIEAFGVIKELATKSGKISGVFKTISDSIGLFGKTVGFIAKIVSKLFAPIAVIMTVFETIKGALDGYAEGGILGALEGAITGFFTSLVTKPLDLIKDLISWIAGALGFENFSTALDSFSFTELFTSFVSSLFNVVEDLMSWIGGLFDITEISKLFESFSVTDTITDFLAYISDFFTNIKDMIGNAFQDLKETFGFGEDQTSTGPSVANPYGSSVDQRGYFIDPITAAADAEQRAMSGLPPMVDPSEVTRQQRVITQQAERIKAEAAKSNTNILNAPTVNNVGGSTTNNSSSSTTIINAAPHGSLDPYSHVMP